MALLRAAQKQPFSIVESANLLDSFLQSVERKAYRIALFATKNEQDALDIVQMSMMKLVEKYADKPADELKPLFYTILQNQTKNHFRKQAQISKWFFWQKSAYDMDDEDDVVSQTIEQGIEQETPELLLSQQQLSSSLLDALQALPVKQQQCFLLRSWEGLSVKETAKAMGCSEGSVKTHMSRASHKLTAIINQQGEHNEQR